MRVLITGGAGFIGSHLAEALLEDGHDVIILDNLQTGRRDSVPDGVVFCERDVQRGLAFGNWEPEVIYHAAGSYDDPDRWERDTRVNVLGTLAMVRAAQHFGARLIYFQTSLCYGLNPGSDLLAPDSPLAPVGSYAVSKTAGERYIADSGVDYVSLRLANVYGPRNLTGPVPAFYRRLRAGEPCMVADSRRDFLYVGDLIDVAVKAAVAGQGVYHVSHGWDVPVSEVYDLVRLALGLEPDDEPEITPRGPDDAPTILLDPSATEREFGWRATTPLDVGIAAAIEWYDANGVEQTYTHLALRG